MNFKNLEKAVNFKNLKKELNFTLKFISMHFKLNLKFIEIYYHTFELII